MNHHIQQLAEGRFQERQEDLRVGLVQRLAEIDEDHISRGLYNSTVRLSARHATHMENLRSILEARVRSVVEAYETASAFLDEDAVNFLSSEVQRICAHRRERLREEASVQAARSQLGGSISLSYVGAAGRDVGREHARAARLVQTEKARHALLREGKGDLPRLDSVEGAKSMEAKSEKSESPKAKRRLHEGHKLAAKSLAWLARQHPEARTRSTQYALLRECPAYEGIRRPRFTSWERYCRDLKQHGHGMADEKADVVE